MKGVILINSFTFNPQRFEQQQDQHAVEPHVRQSVPAFHANHQLQQSAVRAAVRAGRVEESESAVAARKSHLDDSGRVVRGSTGHYAHVSK